MAIDYIVDQPCPVKDTLTQEGMISLIKQRDRGMTVLELLMKDGKTRDQALATVVSVQIMTPAGVEDRDYKVSELLDEARVLDDLQKHCDECLAGRGETFGCLKSIHYPISGTAEAWLAATGKKAVEQGLPHSMALQYIHDNSVTGDQFRQMRADANSSFLELKKPLEVTLFKSILTRKTIYTDQILFLMLGYGKVKNPHHMSMLLSFSDALKVSDIKPAEESCEMAVSFTGDNGLESWRSFNLPESGSDDQSVRELKEFFRTMFVAYVLDRELIVDL